MTLSEAQDDCDMFFSTSIMDDVDGVYLLHGHGTGVLKSGIRRVRSEIESKLGSEGIISSNQFTRDAERGRCSM